jgi:hypothetical protein
MDHMDRVDCRPDGPRGVFAKLFVELVDDDVQLVFELIESVVNVSDEMADPEGERTDSREQSPYKQGHSGES